MRSPMAESAEMAVEPKVGGPHCPNGARSVGDVCVVAKDAPETPCAFVRNRLVGDK